MVAYAPKVTPAASNMNTILNILGDRDKAPLPLAVPVLESEDVLGKGVAMGVVGA